jgi:hypothetical protein
MGGLAAAMPLVENPAEHRFLSFQVPFQAVGGAFNP